MQENTKKTFTENITGMIDGFTKIVEKLGELADKGQEIRTKGSFEGAQNNLSGMYGVSVKFGAGDQGPKVSSFGNIKKDKETGETVVQEVREPMVDIFEESEYTHLIAEMPGIGTDDVTLSLTDDILSISAEKGDLRYKKEVLLPRQHVPEKMKYFCNNGILDVKLYV